MRERIEKREKRRFKEVPDKVRYEDLAVLRIRSVLTRIRSQNKRIRILVPVFLFSLSCFSFNVFKCAPYQQWHLDMLERNYLGVFLIQGT